MSIRHTLGAGRRDEEYLAWVVEDFVRRMLENELRQAGSIQVWLDSVQKDFATMVRVFRDELQNNRIRAQDTLDRQAQVLGTDGEAIAVLWAVHGRLLQHIRPRAVAASLEPHRALAA